MQYTIGKKLRSLANKRHPKTKWDSISIGQFQRIQQAIEHYEGDITRWIKIVSAVYGVDETEIREWPQQKFNRLINRMGWISDARLNQILPDHFIIDDTRYNVIWDMKKINAGQFIDLSTFASDTSQIIPNLHLIMAVMCLPAKASTQTIEDRAKLFQEKLSINIAHPLATFFLQVYQVSLLHVQTYLQKLAQREGISSLQSGDGTPPLTT